MRKAVEHALRENWQRLFSYALRLSGSREEAGDLLQSCAAKALAGGTMPPEPDRARAWLFTILRHVWIDDFRRRQAGEAALAAEPVGPGDWRTDDRLSAEITVRQALERIDPAQREVVELVDIAGFRYAEAAAILGVPVGTVMSRLSRARLALLETIRGENVLPFAARRRNGT